MTRKKLHAQVMEMFDREVRQMIEQRTTHAIQSGSVDVRSEPSGSFGLAKVILASALQHAARRFPPTSYVHKEAAETLSHF